MEARAPASGKERPSLVERETELAFLNGVLEAAGRKRGSAVLLDGPMGIGKSALLSAAHRLASEAGFETETASAHENEREFPFGVALQLFETRVTQSAPAERTRLLEGAGALAMPLLSPGARNVLPSEGETTPLMHGLFGICANVAERAPFALLVDDAHLADESSLRFLLHLTERLAGLPLCVVAAADLSASESSSSLLSEIAAVSGVRTLTLSSLRPEGVAEILRRAFLDPSPEFCAACYTATGGNPFLVHELTADLASRGVDPTPGAAERVATAGPESIARRLMRKIERLAPGAAELALAASTLADGADLRSAARLAELEHTDAARLAGALMAANVLRREEPLTFVHPVVGHALQATRPPAERAEAHLRAARIVADAGGSHESVATHLMLSPRLADPWVVDVLTRAAQGAAAYGRWETAANYLRRALEEPPTAATRTGIDLSLGRAAAAAGERQAVERLREVVPLMSTPRERAATALELGSALCFAARFDEAADAFVHGLADLREGGDALALRLRTAYWLAALMGLPPERADDSALPPLPAHEPRARGPSARLLAAHWALTAALAGQPCDEVGRLARDALDRGALLDAEGASGFGYHQAVVALMLCDELQTAELALSAAVERERAEGSVAGLTIAFALRARSVLLRGRVAEARADAERALEPGGGDVNRPLIGVHELVAETLIEEGRYDEAQRHLHTGRASFADREQLSFVLHLAVRARLRLATGDAHDARADYLESGRRLVSAGVMNPAVLAWRGGAALALAQLGEHQAARVRALEELELARRFATPAGVGRALTILGLVESASRRIPVLTEAVASLESSQAALARARALVALGAALRRGGKRRLARETLRRGLDLAERCGATELARRAREDEAAATATPQRRPLSGADALTPRQRQVALLAAEGLSNRQIADALFVTRKTVESHLRHVYSKLNVDSRTALRGALAPSDESNP